MFTVTFVERKLNGKEVKIDVPIWSCNVLPQVGHLVRLRNKLEYRVVDIRFDFDSDDLWVELILEKVNGRKC